MLTIPHTPQTAVLPPHPAVRGTTANGRPVVDARVLTFRLGAVEYAIGILDVQEIRGYVTPTVIPGRPGYLKGVLNLRGTIVPVVDLRLLFGLAAEVDHSTVTIVLHVEGRVLAVVVDAVSDVVELQEAQVKPAPELGDGLLARNVVGVLTLGDAEHARMALLVDIGQLLTALSEGLSASVH